jgi:pyruvate formate lyase activating enzyme
MKKDARFWKGVGNKKVQCSLCSHNCKIDEGMFGICGVRKNENGKLYALIYGSCSSMAADPIEKKPLYHFYPGTNVFSLGTVGCNFKCKHCQNSSISMAMPNCSCIKEITPEQTIELAREYACQGIAWTYNEPTIWHEFSFDSAKLAKKAGLYSVYVSNGYINEDPLREISPFLDAMNVDVKAFNDDFYKKVCKARLEPVLKTCELAKELDIHLEVTYLVIPSYNDSVDEVRQFCRWVVEKLGSSTPVHFSRFHPDYNMTDVPVTPIETLLKIYDIAKESGILYPYLGNVPRGEYENTICPNCGNICIERCGYSVSLNGIRDGKCVKCGTSISIVTDKHKK